MHPDDDKAITVVWVSYFSTAYLVELHQNLLGKASGNWPIRFVLIDNSDGADTEVVEFARVRDDVELQTIPAHGKVGSPGHAAGLDAAMKHLASAYTLICDPDIHVFKQDWDTWLIGQLEKHPASSVGIPYPFWRVGVYHHYPAPIFHFFKTSAFVGLNQPWTPFAANPFRHAYNFLGRQVVRFGGLANRKNLIRSSLLRAVCDRMEKLFGMVGPDTGYLICEEADRQKLGRVMFEIVAAHHPMYNKLSVAEKELADHWELAYLDGERVLTHKYGSQGRMWATPRAHDVDYWHELISTVEQGE